MTTPREVRRHQILAALAALSMVVLVLIVVTAKPSPRQPTGEPLLDEPADAGPTAPPNGESPPAAVPATPAGGSASYLVPWSAVPTAVPTAEPSAAPEEVKAAAQPARPTRVPESCVEYTWEASDSPAVAGQLLVEIRIRNRCGRVLQPLEVLFRAAGYRDGQPVYSAQGNLLEKIYPDSVRTVMIALQGSATFYDRIEVTPIDPPVR